MGNKEEKRQYFRIMYYVASKPKAIIQNHEFEVQDISEFGLRIAVSEKYRHELMRLLIDGQNKDDACVKAKIVFPDSEECVVLGKVIRVDKGIAVMELVQGIPLSTMMHQHRLLLNSTAND